MPKYKLKDKVESKVFGKGEIVEISKHGMEVQFGDDIKYYNTNGYYSKEANYGAETVKPHQLIKIRKETQCCTYWE